MAKQLNPDCLPMNNMQDLIDNKLKFNSETQYVPSWVVNREVSLDTYYTNPKTAKYCFESLKKILSKKNVNTTQYTFIEPSAGSGSFYRLLPKNKRVGIDVVKHDNEYIHEEFLSWNPKQNKKYIAIGNPPFGYRGWLALAFMNRASEYCDYVGFILPKGFTSESKCSPKYRIPNMKLIHSEELPNDVFLNPDGTKFKANTVWQIWQKRNIPKPVKPDTYKTDEFVELHTVDLRPERLCGLKYMNDYDFFLQRSFFSKPPKIVKNFSEVNYVSGYGFIIKKNKRKIMKILDRTDWTKHRTLTIHNVSHLSMYHIRNALRVGGLYD